MNASRLFGPPRYNSCGSSMAGIGCKLGDLSIEANSMPEPYLEA